jgi:hypothetical protein
MAAFRNYEHELADTVARSRAMGPTVMRTIVPETQLEVWLTRQAMGVLARLPHGQRRLSALQGGPVRRLSAISLKDYQPRR